MAAHFTAYCKRSVADVTPEQLLDGLQIADLHSLAERDGTPDEVVEDALNQLRIENVDPSGFRHYLVCYRTAGHRQIDVQRWQTADEVRDVVAEVLDDMESTGHPVRLRIRPDLEQNSGHRRCFLRFVTRRGSGFGIGLRGDALAGREVRRDYSGVR